MQTFSYSELGKVDRFKPNQKNKKYVLEEERFDLYLLTQM